MTFMNEIIFINVKEPGFKDYDGIGIIFGINNKNQYYIFYKRKERPLLDEIISGDINDVNAENDIVVSFDALEMNEERAAFIQRLSDILTDSGSIGYMKYDIFRFFDKRK